MNAGEREKTFHALVAMMRLVRGCQRANSAETIVAAKPEHIVSLASAHKLMPSIAPALELTRVKEVVDPELSEFFQFIRQENITRNRILLEQISILADRFEIRGLAPPVALKGVAFLVESPDKLSDRFMIDIDFLVAPNELSAVIDAMKELNYSPQQGQNFDPQTDLHYPPFIHPDYDGSVEIHFRLSQSDTVTWLQWDDLVARSKPVTLSKGEIYLPDSEWRLMHLAYHNQINGHYYNRRIISLRDCLDCFDLATRQDVDLAIVRSKFVEVGAQKEFDGMTAFTMSLFDGLLPAGDLVKGGESWANQSRSALIYKRFRTFWLLIDWAQIVIRRLFDINYWKAAFQLIGNKQRLRNRMKHWQRQFKNRLGPDG
jgi:hypothetical protein